MTCKKVHRAWSENTDEGIDTALYSEDDWISNYEYKILYSQLPNYIITTSYDGRVMEFADKAIPFLMAKSLFC